MRSNTKKELLLKYGIPCLSVVVVAVQLFFVSERQLSKWKGGGYGMYSEIHYYYNQIYIPDLSVDSLVKTSLEMKETLGYLMVMPNDKNIENAAKLILETTQRDSVFVQLWKPVVSLKNKTFTRALVNEIYLKKSDL
ncbi:hypothetical protein HNV08_09675 [Winogradskyella eckloniae]|uniref:hypothetical protein n=1 Tax=Winogradskyella eckloniae TaxID=1089306 RepID=UPI0015673029|nr:hypothetical protein [Winogradskyella eckloniae]NRD20315.1 hypothetical protein [Winogradskyella eckloniae]